MLTAVVATKRIQERAETAGAIDLSDVARQTMTTAGPNHLQVKRLLREGKVIATPQIVSGADRAWRCVVEGLVPSANRGARLEIVFWSGGIFVQSVQWV